MIALIITFLLFLVWRELFVKPETKHPAHSRGFAPPKVRKVGMTWGQKRI